MMKRTLSALLALLVVLSAVAILASCSVKPGKPAETTKETETKKSEAKTETQKPGTETQPPAEITFTEASGSVYVNTSELNYRTQPDMEESSIAGQLTYGTVLTRTGVSNNGAWVRITYEEKTYYVAAKYVTDEAYEETRLETPETVYVTADSLFVRMFPNFEDSGVIVGGLKKGQAVTRVAISEEGGYSVILFTPESGKNAGKEGEYYVGSRYLSTTEPETNAETETK